MMLTEFAMYHLAPGTGEKQRQEVDVERVVTWNKQGLAKAERRRNEHRRTHKGYWSGHKVIYGSDTEK